MPAIILRDRWTRQPRAPAAIDWDAPVAAGLVGFFDGATGRDLVTGTRLPLAANMQAGLDARSYGQTSEGSAGGILSNRVDPGFKNWEITSPSMSLVCCFNSLARSSAGQLAGIGFGIGTGYHLSDKYSDGSPQAVLYQGSARVAYGSTGQIKLGQRNVVAMTCDAALLSLYANGALAGTSAADATSITHDATYHRVGISSPNVEVVGAAIAGHWAGLWNRPLARAEIISLTERPWQLFRPPGRRIFFGAAASGVLVGDASGQASASGALTTAIPLAGAALSVATAAGALTTAIPLDGAALAVGTAGGELTAQVTLSGAALAQAVAAAALSSGIILTADAVATAAAAGSLDTVIALIGAAAGTAAASGALATGIPLAGSAAGLAAAAGDLTTHTGGAELAGAASASATAAGTLNTQIPLSGAAQGQAGASGDLAIPKPLAGSATATATAAGALTAQIQFSGAALAQALATGSLATGLTLAGSAAALAAATGLLTAQIRISAAALAEAIVSGSLSTTIALFGDATGQAGASGDLSGGSVVALTPDARYTARAVARMTAAAAGARDYAVRAAWRDYTAKVL